MDELFVWLTIACLALWLLFRKADRVLPTLKSAGRAHFWRSNLVIIASITVFRITTYEMFWIPSGSMEPTLKNRELVLVDKNDYGVTLPLLNIRLNIGREPDRGEIVVFHYPIDEKVFYIKRIVGLPGDLIAIEGEQIYINGVPQAQLGPAAQEYAYLDHSSSRKIRGRIWWEQLGAGWHSIMITPSSPLAGYYPLVSVERESCANLVGNSSSQGGLVCILPDDRFFVMGDNRHRSNDSRNWGFVPRANLVGPATSIAFSLAQYKRSFASLALTAKAESVGDFKPPTKP